MVNLVNTNQIREEILEGDECLEATSAISHEMRLRLVVVVKRMTRQKLKQYE